jgi:hypothetical protein
MDVGQWIRIVILICLVLLAQYQLTVRQRASSTPSTPGAPGQSPRDVTSSALDSPYDLSFPLINRSVPPHSDLKWAITYLHLPTWSPGYHRCDSTETEVSCYEVHRAAETIQRWETAVSQGKTSGQVWLKITSQPFGDRLSMLYHGLQISLATNRNLVVDHQKLAPLQLPRSIRNSSADEGGSTLPTDYQFGCADVSSRFPRIQFEGPSWPQVLYTHPVVAPFMRENFGYHAAHFLGNFLFGTSEKPAGCFLGTSNTAVEGWKFPEDNDMLPVQEYFRYIGRCGVDPRAAAMVTTELQIIGYQTVEVIEKTAEGNLCALRKLMSAKRIIHTFGSRIGFWATSMLGAKGGFVNGIDKICINMTLSQQGSLWHTFVNPERRWVYRTNSWFYICGPNVNDARLYIEYLLW